MRIQSRYVRITPYSAAAAGSRSSRPSSRSAALRTSLGQLHRLEPLAQLLDLGAARGRSRRARPGSPSAAAGGRTRAGPSRSPTGPATGSSSRARTPRARGSRMRETSRSRSSTFASSSSSCFSSVFRRSVDATRWQSALGSSTFAAASWSSSGRYGTSPMMRANRLCTLRVSASTSGDSSSDVRRPRRSGRRGTARPRRGSTSRIRLEALDEDRAASRRGP